ncbi:DUF6400 family protein [Pseudonocardia xinjiangensis]|uniref:DUF6400 family protein n=1 Tax=Pseudonocardia xinjiangensis TaxID=75289 RepID=UPI003D901DEF
MHPTNDGGPERIRPLPLAPPGLTSHSFDLGAHEQRRLAAVLDAMPDLDVLAVLDAETQAHRMLYSGLDAEQRSTYRMLVDAGVLEAGADGGEAGGGTPGA